MSPIGGAGAACAAVVVLSAVVAGERVVARDEHSGKVTVLYWEKWTGSEGEEMRKVVDAFNRSQNRIFVKYLSISGVDQKTMLATAGGDPPDVAGLWGWEVVQYTDLGALMNLKPMADAAGLTADYYIPCYWNMLSYKGGLYALPSTPASTALHINSDLVPLENRTPATFPQTIEEFGKLVDHVTKQNPDGSLKVAGFLPGEPGWWHWAWGYWFGGKIFDNDRVTIDTPENLRAFKWIDSYGKRFGLQAVQNFQSGFGTFSTPQDAFMSGKVATELHGVYKANYIRIYNPSMHWFAIPFPHPADRPDLADRSLVDTDAFMIPSGAKHPKEAFEFIRYVQRQDVMEHLCSAHGKNSPLAKVSDAFFRTHMNPYIRLFDHLARAPGAFYIPKIGVNGQLRDEMNNVFQQISTGQQTPEVALAEAQKRAEGEWKTYREQVLGQ